MVEKFLILILLGFVSISLQGSKKKKYFSTSKKFNHLMKECLPCQRTFSGEIAYQNCLKGTNCTGGEDIYQFPNNSGCLANKSVRLQCSEKTRNEKNVDTVQYYFPDLSPYTCQSRKSRSECVSPEKKKYTCGCCWCNDAN